MDGEITLTREQAQKVRDALGTAVQRYDLMGAFEDERELLADSSSGVCFRHFLSRAMKDHDFGM